MIVSLSTCMYVFDCVCVCVLRHCLRLDLVLWVKYGSFESDLSELCCDLAQFKLSLTWDSVQAGLVLSRGQVYVGL